MESATPISGDPEAGLRLRMLGPLTVVRNGAPIALPASRKVRALLGYLALAPNAVGRSRLCELLWDVPNDPRGELRWCLSKLRTVLDEPDRRRVATAADMIELDLEGCFVDAIEVSRAAAAGLEGLDAERLQSLSTLFAGDFLDGLEIDRSPLFGSWLTAQRRRFRSWHAAVLEQLVKSLPAGCEQSMPPLEKWIEIAPFDERAHVALLGALAERGRMRECEEHLAATARLFEADDLDFRPVREAWHAVKNRGAGSSGAAGAVSVTSASQPKISSPGASSPETATIAPSRASIAVMPFLEGMAMPAERGGLADGLTHDIITRLAKLRDLFIIARGSVFALAEQRVSPEEAGRRLNVDYVASGTVRRDNDRVVVAVELAETRTARIVWAEEFSHRQDDAFIVLDEIGNRIVSSIASEIEAAERNRAMLKPPNSLNAWGAYHRGLWHMYRFTRAENEQAQHFLRRAVQLDPTFARAYAGLSFTHWQSAFQRWGDRDQECDLAFEAAGQSLIADDHNPAAHWAMGRALWLRGRQDESLVELERAVDISPNFALGHYTLAFVNAQSGDPRAAIDSSDHSRRLSPFDPLLFGMMGARAMAHVRLGEFEEAADWAVKAATRPNAHANIQAIAAHCLALAGREAEGRKFAASIHKTLPQYRIEDFLATFQFTPDATALFRQVAPRIGLE